MRKTLSAATVGLITVGMLGAGALTASATHVTPTFLAGNPSCAGGLKIEPVQDGTFGAITIDVHANKTFDFTVAAGSTVSDVIVKGGPNANWYHYDPATTGDTGLHAPNKGAGFYGLSHLCFSIDDKKIPDPK